jgi:excisionase family DNA binding protein
MLLSAKQVAAILGVHPKKVYRLWNTKQLASLRLDDGPRAARRCRSADVEAYIQRRLAAEAHKAN